MKNGVPCDTDQFPMGKYGPKSTDPRCYGEVPAAYLNWLGDQSWISDWPFIKAYIAHNRNVIDFEINNG